MKYENYTGGNNTYAPGEIELRLPFPGESYFNYVIVGNEVVITNFETVIGSERCKTNNYGRTYAICKYTTKGFEFFSIYGNSYFTVTEDNRIIFSIFNSHIQINVNGTSRISAHNRTIDTNTNAELVRLNILLRRGIITRNQFNALRSEILEY